MADLLCEYGCKVGVEIGVRRGVSAKIWLDANPNLFLTCIDPWGRSKRQQENYEITVAELRSYGERVKIIKTTSMKAIGQFDDESLDFVHVDGNHVFDYCAPDIIYWTAKLKKEGIMMVHDYCPFHWSGVMKVVDAYTHCHHIDPWYCTRDKTPTVFWSKP